MILIIISSTKEHSRKETFNLKVHPVNRKWLPALLLQPDARAVSQRWKAPELEGNSAPTCQIQRADWPNEDESPAHLADAEARGTNKQNYKQEEKQRLEFFKTKLWLLLWSDADIKTEADDLIITTWINLPVSLIYLNFIILFCEDFWFLKLKRSVFMSSFWHEIKLFVIWL